MEFGYERERFESISDQFECPICSMIVKTPQECTGCGHLFCKKCLDDWNKRNPRECPNRCSLSDNSIQNITKSIQRMYNNLDIKCINFSNCSKVVKLIDLEKHETQCLLSKCINHAVCGNQQSPVYLPKIICSLECDLHSIIQKAPNQKAALEAIKLFLSQNQIEKGSQIKQQIPSNLSSSVVANVGSMKWDIAAGGTGIKLTNNGFTCFLQDSSYIFRSILGDTAMNSGCHYWEIHADERTENELKIGIATKRDMNYNSAFCDSDYGYAYYGLGQLRHGSNASGPQFGKRFKKEGFLGIYLNMNKGTLSFALNNEYIGVAFTDPQLKKGPIYPAVSLLHQAGCTIKNGMKVPDYFANC